MNALESDPVSALTRAEVKFRLKRFGRNRVTAQEKLPEFPLPFAVRSAATSRAKEK